MMKIFWSIIVPYLLLLIPQFPPLLALGLSLISILICSYKRPDLSLIPISFIISSYLLVRWKSPDSILLAGFRSEVILVFIIGYLSREFIQHKKTLVKIPNEPWIYIFILWCLFCFYFHANGSISSFLLATRENLEVWFLFPFIVTILRKNPKLSGPVIIALCLGAALVAIANIANYYGYISLPYEKYATMDLGNGRTHTHARVYLGFQISRMNALFGVGPGGGGLYYMSLAISSFLSSRYIVKNKSQKLALLVAALFLFWAAFLTASLTIFVSLILSALALFIRQSNLDLKIILAPILVVFVMTLMSSFALLGVELAGTSYQSPIDYLQKGFLNKAITTFQQYTWEELIMGKGLFLRTGTAVIDNVGSKLNQAGSIDISWAVLSNKVGLVGLLLALYFLFNTLKKFVFIRKQISPFKGYLIIAGSLLLSLLAYVHSCPLIMRPFDYPIMLAIAVIFTIYSHDKQLKKIALSTYCYKKYNILQNFK